MRQNLILLMCAGLIYTNTFGQLDSIQVKEFTDSTIINQTVTLISSAQDVGLDEDDYQIELLKELSEGRTFLNNYADSLHAALQIKKALTTFLEDAVNGTAPQLSYVGVKYIPSCINIDKEIQEAISTNTTSALLNRLELKTPHYVALKSALNEITDQLHDYKNIAAPTTAQRRIVISLESRKRGLIKALKEIRWFRCLLQNNDRTIVVNIPSASLQVFEKEELVMESKVIVGKKSTRTPLLSSWLYGITVHPYWYVPRSIATKELLPHIKRNISYLDENNFQVLDEQQRLIDPSLINWHNLSTEYFPYRIRQATGCDNSLGVLRMNISNPYNVYLHDTPWKALFSSENRFFSHGCVRVEKAAELASLLLKDSKIDIDTFQIAACLPDQRPKDFSLATPVPVLILYNTAWFDKAGKIEFYFDVYSKITIR